MAIITRNWFKAAGIRAIKTIAQTAAATLGTASVIENVDWKLIVSASLLSGLLSLLTSVAGLPEVDERTGKIKNHFSHKINNLKSSEHCVLWYAVFISILFIYY